MPLEQIKTIADIVSAGVVTLAAIIGGIWALTRYLRERSDEAALTIDVTCRSEQLAPGQFLAALEVTITNKGRVRLQAKSQREDGLAFDDGVERLAHSCSLQLRQIDAKTMGRGGYLDWFEMGPVVVPVGLTSEINLLSDYEDPESGNQIDFWLEPKESYALVAPLRLDAGVYLAKVAFVGADRDSDFWTRTAVLRVGNPPIAATTP